MAMATLQLVRLRAVQPHAANPGAVPVRSYDRLYSSILPVICHFPEAYAENFFMF